MIFSKQLNRMCQLKWTLFIIYLLARSDSSRIELTAFVMTTKKKWCLFCISDRQTFDARCVFVVDWNHLIKLIGSWFGCLFFAHPHFVCRKRFVAIKYPSTRQQQILTGSSDRSNNIFATPGFHLATFFVPKQISHQTQTSSKVSGKKWL